MQVNGFEAAVGDGAIYPVATAPKSFSGLQRLFAKAAIHRGAHQIGGHDVCPCAVLLTRVAVTETCKASPRLLLRLNASNFDWQHRPEVSSTGSQRAPGGRGHACSPPAGPSSDGGPSHGNRHVNRRTGTYNLFPCSAVKSGASWEYAER